MSGFVFLVGAGPGDPGLLTLAGRAALGRADVVIHDRLAGSALLDFARPGALRVAVGKGPGQVSARQDDIHELMIRHAREGSVVVRLKGGDPFVFARGGEEASALAAAGVDFEVVPGVSSALAAAALVGVPLTQRGLATSFTVVTGHQEAWGAADTDWGAVAAIGRSGGTIVVLMGASTRAEIAARLMDGGLAGSTPVAAVRWASRVNQAEVRCTLAELGDAPIAAPSVLVLGPVAALTLRSPPRPRVVITRARVDAQPWADSLVGLGWDVAVAPVLDVAAVDLASLRERLGDGRSDVVCLTSVHAVDAVVNALRVASGLDARVLAGYVVGAVGSATADRLLERLGVRADVIGAGSGADLASELAPYGSGSVLYPSSDRADSSLADAFATYGRAIDQVVSYRVVNRALGPDEVASVMRADAVVVASPSAAESLAQSVAPDRWPHVVALGPRSADAARACGCGEITVASRPTLPALLGALEDLRVRSGPAATDS